MFVPDTMNNVRRLCTVRSRSGHRVWVVKVAVSNGRYLVRNSVTGEHLTVSRDDITSLY